MAQAGQVTNDRKSLFPGSLAMGLRQRPPQGGLCCCSNRTNRADRQRRTQGGEGRRHTCLLVPAVVYTTLR